MKLVNALWHNSLFVCKAPWRRHPQHIVRRYSMRKERL